MDTLQELVKRKLVKEELLKNNNKFKYNNEIVNRTLLNYDVAKYIDSKKLYDKSLQFISMFQQKLLNKKIENYISGGYAFSLYYDNNEYRAKNNDLLIINDCDLILMLDEKKITTDNILNNVKIILDSSYQLISNKNIGILRLYTLTNYTSDKDIFDIITYMTIHKFDLIYYKPNIKKSIYYIKFIKRVNIEFYIKVEFKVSKIDQFIKGNIYGYHSLNYYLFNKKKIKYGKYLIYNNILPIDFIVVNKRDVNPNILKGSIVKYNYNFKLYNLRFLIYNLMHIAYSYKYNKNTDSVMMKLFEKKNIRDSKRLYYILKLYCNLHYPQFTKNIDIFNSIFKRLKDSVDKFSVYMFKINIKDLDIIDNIINNLS
jgi:hypothetical protein